MPEPRQEGVQGTLLQGADGSLYFISNEELTAFKIPDDAVPSAEGADVSGYDFSEYQMMRAYTGFTAYRDAEVSQTWVMSPTIIPAYVAGWS
jgi:hypothetical protein